MKHTVTEHQLNNGAKGLLVDVPGSGVVKLAVRFNSGPQFGDFSHYEIPHILEHMMGTGNKKYPLPNQFKAEVEKYGAIRNASTSPRFNEYYATFAAFELERMLNLWDEYITAPIFPEDAFPTEVSNVREELTRNTTNHARVCSASLFEQTHPWLVLADEKRLLQLKEITLEMVIDYYKRTHTARNARFYISGDIGGKSDLILDALEKMFAKLPEGERLKPNASPGLVVGKPIVVTRDIKQLYYYFYLSNEGVDDLLGIALKCLAAVLYGNWSSRVYGEARRRGLAYHIRGEANGNIFDSEYEVSGYVTDQHVVELMKLVAEETSAIARGDLNKEDLETAKELLMGRRAVVHQTAGSLGGYYVDAYDLEERIRPYEGELDQIRDIRVSDVVGAARFMLSSDRWGVCWLGNLDDDKAEKYTAPLRAMFKQI
jgi:predicted Zn-dependent peptidase